MAQEASMNVDVKVKTFEVRNAATFIPALAVRVSGADGYLFRRAGFDQPMIYLIHMEGGRAYCDPYDWNNRTMQVAHRHIEENWDTLANEEVIDVEFILGLSNEKKVSERYL